MKKFNTVSFKKKTLILVVVALILIVASQWWTIRMIYAKKFNGDVAMLFARIYHLSAGNVVNSGGNIDIALADYISDENFAFDYLKKQASAKGEEFTTSDQEVREIAWDKILRQTWVENIAKNNKISINDQDIADFYESMGGKDNLQQGLQKAKVNASNYESFVIKPSIMEAKVYKYLLDNFNDLAGMQKAQNAYQALVDNKKDFEEVAKEFSDDMTYVEDSMFVSTDQLGEFGEPIKNLQPGEYTKIMTLPGNPSYYIIWRLQSNSIDPETKQEVKELRGIAIKAKSMDEFFSDWKNNSQINQWYK